MWNPELSNQTRRIGENGKKKKENKVSMHFNENLPKWNYPYSK